MIAAALKREIAEIAAKFGVEKAWLFGSRARGDEKERSDIDIAFLGGDAAAFARALDEDASTLLRFDLVDLSRHADESLRRNIEKDGVLIYAKD